jgi:hypothetical protein
MAFFDDYSDKKFGVCDCCITRTFNTYCSPIFGVGGINETHIFSTSSRPLQYTKDAMDYYKIPKEKKTDYSFLKDKQVSVVRRIIKNTEKMEEYHYPKYKIIEIINPYMWRTSSAKVKCLKTGEIEEINISRIALPILIDKKDVIE